MSMRNMGRDKMSKKEKKPKLDRTQLEIRIANHWAGLGMKSEREYKEWCSKHGFATYIDKTHRQLEDEKKIINREKIALIYKEGKKKYRNPKVAVLAFLDGDDTAALPKGTNDLRNLSKEQRASIKELVCHLQDVSECLYENVIPDKSFVTALPAIVAKKDQWLRLFNTWKPVSHNCRRQFSSFVRHLFGKYEIPTFMDKVWFQTTADGSIFQNWFIHLGLGNNLRTAQSLPVEITKKTAHYFCQAPDHVSINEAIRWGQIHAWGGNVRLAEAILPTKIGGSFDNEEFWSSVVRWFIANPMLDTVHVGPLIDYLENQRFVPQQGFINGEWVVQGPPQPNLSMNKRDANTLLKSVENWHTGLGRIRRYGAENWPSSNIHPFQFEEGTGKNRKVWSIIELLCKEALVDEGRVMKHCAASYAHSCTARRKSIWSMQRGTINGVERRLTIEVDLNSKRITQARGKFNVMAPEMDADIVRRWATFAGLDIANYVFSRRGW